MRAFKVSIAIVAIVFAFSSKAMAHNSGCGFGGWALKNPDTLVLQVFASWLNGICGNQTFAITSGTLDCAPAGRSRAENKDLVRFVAMNMESIAKDAAHGKGETLDTLSELLEVPVASRPLFGATLQANFSSIFSKVDIQAPEVVENIAYVAQSHHLL